MKEICKGFAERIWWPQTGLWRNHLQGAWRQLLSDGIIKKRQDNLCPSADHIVWLKLHGIKPWHCVFPLPFYTSYKPHLLLGFAERQCFQLLPPLKRQCPWCCCLSTLASSSSCRCSRNPSSAPVIVCVLSDQAVNKHSGAAPFSWKIQ